MADTVTDRRSPAAREKRPADGDAIELTVVVPTFNEAGNVPILVERLGRVLAGISWEVVFVDDDSPDGTSRVAREIARRDRRVRVIRRLGRRGLSTACVEGVMSSAAPYFAVMDGDLQHDDTMLATMLATLKAEKLDIVVGSRYVSGGNTEGLAAWRKQVSRAGTRMAQTLLKAELTDPMSGFFVMARAAFDEEVHALSQRGFKILLDIFASSPRPLRFRELACGFNPRLSGESKLDTMVAWEFGLLLIDKLIGRYVPVHFVVFAMVGVTGIAVHLITLEAFRLAGSLVRRGADRRGAGGDDVELRPQQRHHLSRPAPARRRLRARPAVVLCHRRHRCRRQYRRHRRPVQSGQRLVAGRNRRRADRRRVELHDVEPVHLAAERARLSRRPANAGSPFRGRCRARSSRPPRGCRRA